MTESNLEIAETDSNSKKQFGIASIFWITFMVGLTIAFMQRVEATDILFDGVFSIAMSLAVGALIGWLTGKMADALFWSSLVAAFAYLSTASDPVYVPYHRIAWALVGATTAGTAATCFTKNILLNWLTCAAIAFVVMAAFGWIATNYLPAAGNVSIDMMISPLIGIAVAGFVRVLLWLESQKKMPRYITATWLLIAVILGTLAARG